MGSGHCDIFSHRPNPPASGLDPEPACASDDHVFRATRSVPNVAQILLSGKDIKLFDIGDIIMSVYVGHH